MKSIKAISLYLFPPMLKTIKFFLTNNVHYNLFNKLIAKRWVVPTLLIFSRKERKGISLYLDLWISTQRILKRRGKILSPTSLQINYLLLLWVQIPVFGCFLLLLGVLKIVGYNPDRQLWSLLPIV